MGIDLKINNADLLAKAEFWNTHKSKFDDFAKKLGTKPKDTQLRTNKFANNAKYLEIGYLEMQLDRLFHGLWSLKVDDTKQVLNSVQVTVTLSVFNPVAQIWIHRSGIGAKEIQLKKDTKDFIAENLSSKCLERDIPIAKAEAFKNACKSLGNSFGRHLNRDFDYDFIPDVNDVFSIKTK